ncbi:hypothetical protein ACFXDP_00045 [Streptomyces sp. NPDC059374]|uniref:hypothetical protein n=1 Tax=Streptomyces sp. NPDC059374 TaxID=3346814 RepID=UPI0036B4A1BC
MLPALGPAATPSLLMAADDVDQDLVLQDLTREQVLDWRTRAARDHQVVFDRTEEYGETSAQRLSTRAFVTDVQRLSRLGHLNFGYTTGAGGAQGLGCGRLLLERGGGDGVDGQVWLFPAGGVRVDHSGLLLGVRA